MKNFHYKDAPFVHGWSGILSVFLVAGFSFQGTELIGITAGEAATPEESVSKAIHSTFGGFAVLYFCNLCHCLRSAIYQQKPVEFKRAKHYDEPIYDCF